MAKFLFVYRNTLEDQCQPSPEEMQEAMAKWGAWFEKLGSAVIDGGDGSATGNIANAGLERGTFGGTTAGVTSVGQSGNTGAVNALVAGDVVLNGVSIGASLATDGPSA